MKDDNELIQKINQAAYEVRLHLAPGYLEAVYRNALVMELRAIGLLAEPEKPLKVYYKGHIVGDYVADIIVENRIILELKAVREISPAHEAQLVNYLHATGLQYGVLINYGGDRFVFHKKTKDYFQR